MPVSKDAELTHQLQLTSWISQDAMRMQALNACAHTFAELAIHDWLIAAGFVRNLVWDHLHGYSASKLNDIDVIYYCHHDISEARDKAIEQQLTTLLPQNFSALVSVKNQARMHIRNADDAYLSCVDAMRYWPEKQTAVGVKLNVPSNNAAEGALIQIKHVFGLECLFDLSLSHNPKRNLAVFQQRVEQKQWRVNYPKLVIR